MSRRLTRRLLWVTPSVKLFHSPLCSDSIVVDFRMIMLHLVARPAPLNMEAIFLMLH